MQNITIVLGGDLLSHHAHAYVNTVNCVGVMGKGIAAQFKSRFPEMFQVYRRACQAGQVKVGRMHLYETGLPVSPRLLINFPTKVHWRDPAYLASIDAGLEDLTRVVRQQQIPSLAIPALGCGLGGLPWPLVRDRIVDSFGSLPEVAVYLFAPQGG